MIVLTSLTPVFFITNFAPQMFARMVRELDHEKLNYNQHLVMHITSIQKKSSYIIYNNLPTFNFR